MRRRDFIVGLGGTAALSLTCWSHRSSAQQRTGTVGVLFGTGENARMRPAFLQALSEAGFAEGRNIAFVFRFASGQFDRLPALAADLVRQRVDLIYTAGLPHALAAKAATATIPIVFTMGEDPVKEGVVASLARPGGNVTGFTGFSNQLMAKRLELLHQAVPKATTIAFLVNPNRPNAAPDTADAQAAAVAHGLSLRVLAARSERDFEEAFATISQERIGGLLVGVDVPAIYWVYSDSLKSR
jgi:putative tryptophan/tyrosine transport system substrate-binding protein